MEDKILNTMKTDIARVAMNINHILLFHGNMNLLMMTTKFILHIATLTHILIYKTFSLRYKVITYFVIYASVKYYVKR